MKDFTTQLEERLHQLALAGSAAPANAAARMPARRPVPARRPRRSVRLGVAASGLGGLVIAAASATVLTGSSVASLPILRTPTTDATALTRGLVIDHPIDFNHAHVIRTADGTAAVTTTDEGNSTCLAIPDPAPGAGAMGSCKSTDAVELTGFLVQSFPVRSPGRPTPRAAVAFILPVGASGVRLVDGGRDSPVSVTSGVALAHARGPARLRYALRGSVSAVAIAGPFPEGKAVCPDGHLVTPVIVPGSDAHGAPGHLDIRKLCAGHERAARGVRDAHSG